MSASQEQGGTSVKPEVINRLSAKLSEAAFRKSFFNDPYKAMERAGIKVGDVPHQVVDVLAHLSLEELQIVSRLQSQTDLIQKVADDIKGGLIF